MGLMDKAREAARQAAEQAKASLDGVLATPAQNAPAAPTVDAGGQPLLTVTSHISGKNAKVSVYPDRIEWEKPKSISGAKVTAAVLTAGLSAAATGGVTSRAGTGTEVIYIDAISSVTTKRDTMFNDVVSVVAAGNTIDFRVSKAEAEQLKATILQARSTARTTPTAPRAQPVTSSVISEPSIADRVRQLSELHAAGVLSDDEFAAAKAKALGL